MPKPLTCNGKWFSGSNSISTRILSQAPARNQVVFEVSDYIRKGSLSSALDLLEKRGITGDTAIFVLANLQALGGRS